MPWMLGLFGCSNLYEVMKVMEIMKVMEVMRVFGVGKDVVCNLSATYN